jgi:transcriptional antiterminator
MLQAYTLQRLQHFAHHFARRVNPQLTREQVEYVTNEVVQSMAALQEPMAAIPQQNLRLVLRHDCL